MNRFVKNLNFFALTLCLALPQAYAQKGADKININGQLVLAARNGTVERIKELLGEGAVVNSRNRNGDSPLNLAASKGNEELVEVLLQAGADVNLANLSGVTPLMGAAFNAKPSLFKKLLDAGAQIEPIDRVKKTAATYAAANGCTACLRELHGRGVPLNNPMTNQLTLLMWAAAYGHEDTVRFLLEIGSDRAQKDDRGKTAADMAREGNHLGLAKLLGQG